MKGNKRFANILWLGFEKFGLVLLSAVSFFTFALYLTPAELGLAAIAIVFCELLTQFLSSSIENPIVRRAASNNIEMSSAFWLGGAFSIALTLLVGFLFYLIDSESNIWLMIVVLTISVLTSILARPFIARLRHKREFKSLAIRTIWGKIFGAFLAILVAINGGGEWSLIVQLIAMNTISLLILLKSDRSFIYEKPSFNAILSLLKEGIPIAFRKLLNGFFDRGVIIMLAAMTNPATVGYFTFARRLVELPKQALDSALVSYSLPAFTNRANQSDIIGNFFTQISLQTLFLTLPIFVFYGVFGEQLITDVFGEKWAPSTIYFIFFAVIAAIQMLSIFVPPLQAAFGNSTIGLKAEFTKVFGTLSLAYFLGLNFGVVGVISVIALDICLLAIIRFYSVSQFLDVSLKRLLNGTVGLISITSIIAVSSAYIIDYYSLTFGWLVTLGGVVSIIYLVLCRVILKLSPTTVFSFIKNSK